MFVSEGDELAACFFSPVIPLSAVHEVHFGFLAGDEVWNEAFKPAERGTGGQKGMGAGEFPLFAYVQKGVFFLCPEGFVNCLRRGETVSCHILPR
jgi:hypothetical protein